MANQLPSYWGNPPQTPVSKHAPQPSPSPAPQPPVAPDPPAEPVAGPEVQTAVEPAAQPAEQSVEPVAQPTEQPAETQPEQPAQPTQPIQPEPPQPSKKKTNVGVVIAVSIIAGLAILISGFAACGAITGSAIEELNESSYSEDDLWDDLSPQDDSNSSSATETDSMNASLRSYYGLSGSSAISSDDLDNIAKQIPGSMLVVGKDQKEAGVYKIGEDLDAGTYWFQNGSAHSLCYFYVLDPSSEGYNVSLANNYYGHNLIDVKDGQVLIVDNSGTITSIDKMTQTFKSPYTSGVYRVGVDVPAGTYQLSVGDGIDSNYSAYYVMSDLKYENSSYIENNYFISNDDPGTITLKEGTYIELLNMTMTPAE